MAKIQFKCPCGKVLSVDEQHAGKLAKCPGCGKGIRVPQPPKPPPPEEPKAKKPSGEPTSLANAYGAAMLARARTKRVKAALAHYETKSRKRTVLIVISVVSALILSFVTYKLLESFGPNLGPLGRYPAEAQDFLNGLNKRDPAVRAAATWEVADACGDQLTSTLAEMLNENESLVKLVTIRALGRIDRRGAAQYLEPLLKDDGLDVRMTAAFVLTRCETAAEDAGKGNLFRTPALSANVGRALGEEREWRSWLDGMSPEEVPGDDVAAFLDGKIRDRRAATRALAAWMTAATLGPDQRMLPLLRDPEPAVRLSAINALQPFLAADTFEHLTKKTEGEQEIRLRIVLLQHVALRIQDDPEPEVRRAAALALASSGQAAMAGLLARGLHDDDWFIRFAAAKGLSALDAPTALNAIGEAGERKEENEWVRRVLDRIQKVTAEEDTEAE